MEVELRYKLPDMEKTKALLSEKGFVFKKASHQIDIYWLRTEQPDTDTCFMDGDDSIYMRLRHDVSGGKFSFNLKYINDKIEHGTLHEFEGKLADEEALKNLDAVWKKIGYKHGTVIDKAREVFVRGEFTVALDRVKDVGDFIEIEIMCRDCDALAVKDRVRAMAAELGLDPDACMPYGYVELSHWKKIGKAF